MLLAMELMLARASFLMFRASLEVHVPRIAIISNPPAGKSSMIEAISGVRSHMRMSQEIAQLLTIDMVLL